MLRATETPEYPVAAMSFWLLVASAVFIAAIIIHESTRGKK